VLGVERQREDVVLGQQLADVPRVLARLVDLRRAGRDPLLSDLPDRVAEVEMFLRDRVDVCLGLHVLDGSGGHSPGNRSDMGIGTSIFLIALGAILKFAVTDAISGVDLATVGVILMVAGILGLVISLFYTLLARDRAAGTVPARERYVERDPLP
jgi:hypothetical protein